ncbi:hypothetical protein F5887DRAFT_921184 [Amanita rubescens]|nr:hypothetical protein F5887DRAFT_921184 [Amanita rubescens]
MALFQLHLHGPDAQIKGNRPTEERAQTNAGEIHTNTPPQQIPTPYDPGTVISQLSALRIEDKPKPLQSPIPYHFDTSICDPYAKYYVVTAGRQTGIFDDWIAAQRSYQNFPGGECKSHKSLWLAREAWLKHCQGTQETAARLAGEPSGVPTPSVVVQSGGNRQQNHAESSGQTVARPAVQSDNGDYWVVSRGEHPGVYPGCEQAVQYGIGSADAGFVRRFRSHHEGNAAFVKSYMAGEIVATSDGSRCLNVKRLLSIEQDGRVRESQHWQILA